jgi:hypothetical protein
VLPGRGGVDDGESVRPRILGPELEGRDEPVGPADEDRDVVGHVAFRVRTTSRARPIVLRGCSSVPGLASSPAGRDPQRRARPGAAARAAARVRERDSEGVTRDHDGGFAGSAIPVGPPRGISLALARFRLEVWDAFFKTNLAPNFLRGVQAMGYTEPTPIQLRAIPVVMSGKDLIASAQTGTGKTAAFALPVLSLLGIHKKGGPRVLVLEPTRELAAQVETAFRDFARFSDIRATVLHGGVGYGRQRSELRAGTDIVVATPAA